MPELLIPIACVVILFWIVLSNIYVVQQSRAYVIERLGAFHGVQGVGIHFKVPFLELSSRLEAGGCAVRASPGGLGSLAQPQRRGTSP